jgi:hypothetical protein
MQDNSPYFSAEMPDLLQHHLDALTNQSDQGTRLLEPGTYIHGPCKAWGHVLVASETDGPRGSRGQSGPGLSRS